MPITTLAEATLILDVALSSGMDREIQYWRGYRDALQAVTTVTPGKPTLVLPSGATEGEDVRCDS